MLVGIHFLMEEDFPYGIKRYTYRISGDIEWFMSNKTSLLIGAVTII